MNPSIRYIAQYRTSAGEWAASSSRGALTQDEAAAYIAKQLVKHPESVMRIIKSTKQDGLINQEVVYVF